MSLITRKKGKGGKKVLGKKVNFMVFTPKHAVLYNIFYMLYYN